MISKYTRRKLNDDEDEDDLSFDKILSRQENMHLPRISQMAVNSLELSACRKRPSSNKLADAKTPNTMMSITETKSTLEPPLECGQCATETEGQDDEDNNETGSGKEIIVNRFSLSPL